MTTKKIKRAAWLFVAAMVWILMTAGTAQANIHGGLVSYWPFDADLNDAVGSNNGTLVGTDPVANLSAGQFGNGIDLDGIDQYVDVGNASDLDMSVLSGAAGNGHVSISAWFRVDAFTKGWQALVAKGERFTYRVQRRGGGQIMSYAGGVGDIPGAGVGPVVSDGLLHHVVAISENGVSTRLWVDGMLVATGGAPSINNEGDLAGTNPSLQIGGNPQVPDRTWDGLLDDVGIWNRPLTAAEVGAIYNGGLQGNSLGTIIPEPSSIVLAVFGLAFLGWRRRRTRA